MKDVMTFTRAQAQDFLRARHLLTNKEFAVIEKCLWEKRIVAPKDLARALAMAIMAESGRRQRMVRKNPIGIGPKQNYCDFGHMALEIRALPLGGGGNALLCRHHYEQEKRARAEQGVSTPEWKQLRVYQTNPCKNPVSSRATGLIEQMAIEHELDAQEHKTKGLKMFDSGTAAGLREGLEIARTNPMHPYEYHGRIEDYGGTYRIGPRSLGGIKKWAEFHKFKVGNLEEVLKETRPGDKREWANGPRRCIITKVFRQKYLSGYPQVKAQMDKAIEKNPKFVPFKPNFKRASDYLRFLTDTFIPDLKESGSSYELDFKTIASMLTSDKLHTSDLEYIDWLKTTLIPDTIESGKTSTAQDLQEGIYWIARTSGYGTRIQMKPKALRHWPSIYDKRYAICELDRSKEPKGLGMTKTPANITCPACRNIAGIDSKGDVHLLGNASGDPYKCDFAAEERKARGMTMDELNYALIDAMKATKGANPDKYYDQASVYRKELLRRERKGTKNPMNGAPVEGAELIGTDCLAMEYLDVPKAKREGIKNPTTPWRHDFEVKGTKIWGLPDGRVLLDGPKPLWRSQPNSVTGK